MRRAILLLTLLTATLIGASSVAWAITGSAAVKDAPTTGYPNGKYDRVGVLYDNYWGFYCSGTVIQHDIFLTAGHCYPSDDYGNRTETAKVYLSPEVGASGSTAYTGRFVSLDNKNDIAVVKFAANTFPESNFQQRVALPVRGQFNNAAKTQKFTGVGYGDTCASCFALGNVRRYTPPEKAMTLNTIKSTTMQLFQKDGSGTCYGDSGGPNFLGADPAGTAGADTIAGITISGDGACKATNVIYRLDTDTARNFLRNNGVTVP